MSMNLSMSLPKKDFYSTNADFSSAHHNFLSIFIVPTQ